MRRSSTGFAKVTGCRHDTLPEDVMPDSIHHHARCQRMFVSDQPICKGCPPIFPSCIGVDAKVSIELNQSRRPNFVAFVFGAATSQHVSFAGLNETCHETWLRTIFGKDVKQPLNFCDRFCAFWFLLILVRDIFRMSDLLPLSVGISNLDDVLAKVFRIQFIEILNLHRIFAIGADSHAIDRLGRIEIKLQPWTLL